MNPVIFEISLYQNGSKHTLHVELDSSKVQITYNGNAYNPIPFATFFAEVQKYTACNIPYNQKHCFWNLFKIPNFVSIECLLLRVLAITVGQFEADIMVGNLNAVKQIFDSNFFDQLYFEWISCINCINGKFSVPRCTKTCVLPYIYMIDKNLIQKYPQEIPSLYQQGILGKYEPNFLTSGDTSAYFVPFDYEENPSLTSPNEILVWNSIKMSIRKNLVRIIASYKK